MARGPQRRTEFYFENAYVILLRLWWNGAGALARQADRGGRTKAELPQQGARAGELRPGDETAYHLIHRVRRTADILPDTKL